MQEPRGRVRRRVYACEDERPGSREEEKVSMDHGDLAGWNGTYETWALSSSSVSFSSSEAIMFACTAGMSATQSQFQESKACGFYGARTHGGYS